jgi:hypothetical protein
MGTLQKKVQRTKNHLQFEGAEQYGNFPKDVENLVEVLLELTCHRRRFAGGCFFPLRWL